MEIASSYTPYKPTEQSMLKRRAARASNISQGNTGQTDPAKAAYLAAYAPPQQQAGNRSYGTEPMRPRTQHLLQSATTPQPQQGAYTPQATSVTPPYPAAPAMTTRVWEQPTNYTPVNYEQALADTPDANKQIAQWILDAYNTYLGRPADEPGYFANLHSMLALRIRASP